MYFKPRRLKVSNKENFPREKSTLDSLLCVLFKYLIDSSFVKGKSKQKYS